MKTKAKSSYDAAVCLVKNSNFNGAANRAYYALYQGIVSELESLKIDQSRLTAKVSFDDADKWLHEVVRNNSTLAGVHRKDARIVRAAWMLRQKADYFKEPVTSAELEEIMERLPVILRDLNVLV